MREVLSPAVSSNESPIPVHQPPHQRAHQVRAANAFLATKITFINEMGRPVREGRRERAGRQPRDRDGPTVSVRSFLHAGPGYGGSCFPKDTLALLKTAEDYDSPTRIVEAGGGGWSRSNDSRKAGDGPQGRGCLGRRGTPARGKKAALLGLTFKPNTDDMRDSPAIAVAQTLNGRRRCGGCLRPRRHGAGPPAVTRGDMCDSPYAAIEGADVGGDRDRMGRLPCARSEAGQGTGQCARARGPAAISTIPKTCTPPASPITSIGRA